MHYIGYGKTGDKFFDSIWSFLVVYKLDKKIRIVIPNIQSLQMLIALADGVPFSQDYTVQNSLLRSVPISGLSFRSSLWVAIRRSSTGSPMIRTFLKHLGLPTY